MAPTTGKWFYEMGTPDGLVDFEAMMRAIRDDEVRGLDHRGARQGQQVRRRLLREHRNLALVRRQRPRAHLPLGADMNTIRWSYAINQYKPQFDDFVRREKTTSGP